MEKKKVRILFLDIDGILNSETYYKRRAENKDTRPYPLSESDPEAVQQCMRIIEETGAKTVISSSWRHTDGLRSIFKNVGFRGSILDFDITPYLGTVRGLEIKKYMTDYLDKHPDEEIESYCILDDDIDMLYEQKDNFVKCDAYFGGLTKDKADEAINILNKKGALHTFGYGLVIYFGKDNYTEKTEHKLIVFRSEEERDKESKKMLDICALAEKESTDFVYDVVLSEDGRTYVSKSRRKDEEEHENITLIKRIDLKDKTVYDMLL